MTGRKKKAGKKKTKKTKKKSVPRVPSSIQVGPSMFRFVRIRGGNPVPLEITVAPGDHIIWVNQDPNEWWVTFLGDWPFKGPTDPVEPIQVPVGGPSALHVVTKNPGSGSRKRYPYLPKKRRTDPDPPPDGPGVIVDGG